MSNRIVVPANFTVEVVIKLDPVTGRSELQVRNRSKVQFTTWQVAGLMLEHATNMFRSLLAGTLKQTPLEENKTEVVEGKVM